MDKIPGTTTLTNEPLNLSKQSDGYTDQSTHHIEFDSYKGGVLSVGDTIHLNGVYIKLTEVSPGEIKGLGVRGRATVDLDSKGFFN